MLNILGYADLNEAGRFSDGPYNFTSQHHGTPKGSTGMTLAPTSCSRLLTLNSLYRLHRQLCVTQYYLSILTALKLLLHEVNLKLTCIYITAETALYQPKDMT